MEPDEQLIQEMESEADEMQLRLVVGAVIIDADIGHTLRRLSVVFQALYERTADVNDLDRAIRFQTKLVDFPLGDPLFERLGQLSDLYKLRFKSTAEARDIEQAILFRRIALDSLPPDHPSRPEYLGMLGLAYSTRYTLTKEVADIEKGLSLTNQALETSSPHQAPKILDILASSLKIRFQATDDLNHLNEAISTQMKAVELTMETPDQSNFDIGRRLYALSRLLRQSSLVTRDLAGMRWAARMALLATEVILRSGHTHPIAASTAAVMSLSVSVQLENTVEDRHESLKGMSSVSLAAATMAFKIDRVDRALELLEQGRGLVWRQLTDLRTPLDGLRLHDESLAERVQFVSRALDKAGTRTITDEIPVATSVNSTRSSEETLEHLNLAEEWDELVQTVRAISGFEDFLQPPSISALLENLPDGGPVVIINVHETRCDAIGLIAGLDPLHIPLPLFSLKKAESLRKILRGKLGLLGSRSVVHYPEEEVGDSNDLDKSSSRKAGPLGGRKKGIATVLEALWINLVKPILDALRFSPSDVPGRIWWCPTGPLTFLPIHAAGIYTGERQVILADYAVSSYTPTVTSLTAIIQGRPKFEDDGTAGIALIANAGSTESLPPVPGTTIEISNILQQTSASQIPTLVLEGENATTEATLAGMEIHSCIHFACHAAQNADSPLRSGFYLHGGKLPLSTIMKKNLKHADLAFLSACQTSTGANDLSEEAVHLAAGMMLAGYRGVIGTMWSIPDKHAPFIAQEFYTDLLRRSADGKRKVDGVHAAYALHHSVQALRSQLADTSDRSFLAWVPYVHFGL